MQSVQRINLKHLKKCDQVWEDMLPNEKGRLCSKCQNTIIDFRNLSDKEIAEIHVFTKGKVCGLYHPKQLKIERPTKQRSKLKPIYLSLLGMLSTVSLTSQEQNNRIETEQVEKDYTKRSATQQKMEPVNSIKEDSIVVSGTLLDENKEMLIGVNVWIKGTTAGTSSDINGFYFLDITEHISKDTQIILEYTYTGFKPLEVVINKEDIAKKKHLERNLSFEASMIGVSEFYVVRAPFHKRVWHRIKSIFRVKR